MNGNRFEKWFQCVLKKLPEGSAIVIDNLPYHCCKVEAVPTTASRRDAIVRWLTEKGVPHVAGMSKKELTFQMYRIDTAAENVRCVVLRPPPYHCELNPTELTWAQVNNGVTARNRTLKLSGWRTS